MMDPTCFSFKKISEKNGVSIYYTNPAKGKQSVDSNEISEFYENAIKKIYHKKWIWIFDSYEYDLAYGLDIKSGIEFTNLLINKYGDNLLEIKIINPIIPIKLILKAAMPFIDKAITDRIKMLTDRYYSVIEFM